MRYVLFFLSFCLNSFAQEHSREYLNNSCLINSIGMYEDVNAFFNNRNIWNNVLAIKFVKNGRKYGHAVTVFYWNNNYYAYDINQGSWQLSTSSDLKNNPMRAARIILKNTQILEAQYLVR